MTKRETKNVFASFCRRSLTPIPVDSACFFHAARHMFMATSCYSAGERRPKEEKEEEQEVEERETIFCGAQKAGSTLAPVRAQPGWCMACIVAGSGGYD